MIAEKLLVQKILESPLDFEWSIQGLGMLRLYLNQEWRLHIWHHEFKVENVSQLHTHPWDFVSHVIAGQITNQKYMRLYEGANVGAPCMEQRLHCGPGGCLIGEPRPVRLLLNDTQLISQGMVYSQTAGEIHLTDFEDGTVTLVERCFIHNQNVDHALVYWNKGEQWVGAEPRPATREEIHKGCAVALTRWFRS